MRQQFQEDMIKMEKLLDAAVAQYENGLPIHLSNPKKSAITVMTESQYLKMTAKEVQDTLRHNRCPGPSIRQGWDEDPLLS